MANGHDFLSRKIFIVLWYCIIDFSLFADRLNILILYQKYVDTMQCVFVSFPMPQPDYFLNLNYINSVDAYNSVCSSGGER